MLDRMTCKHRGAFESPNHSSIFRLSLMAPLLATSVGLWIGSWSESGNARAAARSAEHEISGSSQADDQVATLIVKLNSPLFADREAAWRELHGRGKEVREALVQRLKTADRELASRIREIVGLIDLEIPNDLPSDVIELLLTFADQDADLRTQTISSLYQLKHYKLIYDLAERTSDRAAIDQIIGDVFSLPGLITNLMRNDDWQTVETLIMHPFNLSQHAELACYWRMASGQIRSHISQLELNSKGDGFTDEECRQLIAMLRIEGRLTEAIEWTQKLADERNRKELERSLRIESGDWNWVLEQFDLKLPMEKRLAADLAQFVVASQLAGNASLFEQAESEVQRRLAAMNDSPETELDRRALQRGLLAIGRVDDAMKVVTSQDNSEAARVAIYFSRFSEAESILGLKEDLDARLGSELIKKIRKLLSADADYERNGNSVSMLKADAIFEELLMIVELLESQGLDTQAIFVLQQIANAVGPDGVDSDERLGRILNLMVNMRNREAVWSLINARFRDPSQSFWQLNSQVFAGKSTASTFWFYRLAGQVPDFHTRLRLVAQIVNNPILRDPNEAPFDFGAWLGTLDPQLLNQHDTVGVEGLGGSELFVGLTWLFHGREDKYLETLRALSNDAPLIGLTWQGRGSFEKHDWETAARVNDKVWQSPQSPTDQAVLAALRSAKAYAELGDQSKRAQRNFAASVLMRNFGMTSEGLQSVIDEGFGDELAMIQLTGLVTNVNTDDPFSIGGRDLYVRNLVASGWQKNQPHRAIEQLNSVLISALGPEAGGNSVFIANLPQRIRLLRVSELTKKGELNAATELLAKCIHFRPADASIAEEQLAQLLAAGATDSANRLLRMVQEGFYQQLARYPTSALLLNNLAWTNACCRADLQFSTELAERAVKLRPDYPNYLDTLAELYFLQGQREKAIEVMKQCLSQQPDKPHYRRQIRRFQDPNAR